MLHERIIESSVSCGEVALIANPGAPQVSISEAARRQEIELCQALAATWSSLGEPHPLDALVCNFQEPRGPSPKLQGGLSAWLSSEPSVPVVQQGQHAARR
jgi:hypothetical protein